MRAQEGKTFTLKKRDEKQLKDAGNSKTEIRTLRKTTLQKASEEAENLRVLMEENRSSKRHYQRVNCSIYQDGLNTPIESGESTQTSQV